MSCLADVRRAGTLHVCRDDMACWRVVLSTCLLGLALAAGACGSTEPESPLAPTALTGSFPSLAGRWRALLSVSLRDQAGGGWSPYRGSDPAEVAFYICTGSLAVTSQNGGPFSGWTNLVELNSVSRFGIAAHAFCPPLGYQNQSGRIDQNGTIILRLPRRELPYCNRVSGDSSLFRGGFTTPPAGCPECGDIVLESTEFVTCTALWRQYDPAIERRFNAERRETLRFIGPPQPVAPTEPH